MTPDEREGTWVRVPQAPPQPRSQLGTTVSAIAGLLFLLLLVCAPAIAIGAWKWALS